MLPSDDLPAGFDDLRGEDFASRYAVDELLAAARRRVLFSGEDRDTQQRVVIRLARPLPLHDEALRERFDRQMQTCRRLRHPVIVRPIESGTLFDGTRYVVSRAPRGEPLDHHLAGRSAHRLSWADAHPLLLDLVQALHAAHARRLIHGLLSPASCWVDDSGDRPTLRLLDLGLDTRAAEGRADLSVSRTNSLSEDATFMAPEMIAGSTVDAQTDIYLVGLMAHVMLTGQPPFCAPNNFQLASMHLRQPVPELSTLGIDVPPALQQLLTGMLAKEPAARPDMGAVEHALLDLGPAHPVEPRASRRRGRAARSSAGPGASRTGVVRKLQGIAPPPPPPTPHPVVAYAAMAPAAPLPAAAQSSPPADHERTTNFRRSDLMPISRTLGSPPPSPPPCEPSPVRPPATLDDPADSERTVAVQPMRKRRPAEPEHTVALGACAPSMPPVIAAPASPPVATPPTVALSAVPTPVAAASLPVATPPTVALSAIATPVAPPASPPVATPPTVALPAVHAIDHVAPAQPAMPGALAPSPVAPRIDATVAVRRGGHFVAYPPTPAPPPSPSNSVQITAANSPAAYPPSGPPSSTWATPAGTPSWSPPAADCLVTRREPMSYVGAAIDSPAPPLPVAAVDSRSSAPRLGLWALAFGLVAAIGVGMGLTLALT